MKIIEDKKFSDLTTFRIGGKIKYFAEVKDKKQVEEAVCFAKSNKLPVFIIGGGSNILPTDKPFDGLVIKYLGDSYSIEGDVIAAEGGMVWDDLVAIAVKNGLQGLESLSGIPGTVGASPIQNIGAYGDEMSNHFLKLEAFDIQKEEFVIFEKKDCKFGYRDSIFKDEKYWQKYLITNVSFKLNKRSTAEVNYESLKGIVESGATIEEIRKGVLKIRGEKLENPKEHGNAGSFFKSPMVQKDKLEELQKKYPDIKFYESDGVFKIPAGWLIEKAGWKGKGFTGAAVSPKHALILINKSGQASFDDVYELSENIIDDIYQKFGLKLEREVQIINYE